MNLNPSAAPLSPAVYLRAGLAEEAEAQASAAFFPTHASRVEVAPGSLVFCRYSALPFNAELCHDLELLGSRCVNSAAGHRYVADFEYYEDFRDATFPSWERFDQIPQRFRDGPFVVKGKTNSRKQEWSTKMFAPNFRRAVEIGSELMTDGLIGTQGLAIRQYVPLETFETSLGGLPFANEWRCFYLGGERVAHGYYWGSLDDMSKADRARDDFMAHGLPLADQIAAKACERIAFCAIDVAKTQDGRWMLVEINDGNMSGLNGTINPVDLYSGLDGALRCRPDLLAAPQTQPLARAPITRRTP